MAATVPRLWTDNRAMARRIANDYWLPGADHDDVEQEALIALWEACRKWDRDRCPNFKPYAAMVIRGRLNSAVTRHRRPKNLMLTDAVRDDLTTEDGDPISLWDTLPAPCAADDLALFRATLIEVRDAGLTDLELSAIARVMAGYGCTERTMCNALNRARRKLKAVA